ncbi:MAG: DUF4292 domain-containing protein [Thermodesulfobacteriota bacterium]
MKKFVLILISLTILATGCSTLRQRAEGPLATSSSPEAEALFNRLQSRNSDLHSFKGTGRIRMEGDDGIQHARLMWAGYQNEKLRLEVMAGTGRPVFSFADDGDRIYLISHTENRFYSKRSSNATLEKLISLPITVSACLDLLAGRIPAETRFLPMTVQQGEKDGEQILVLEGLKRASGSQKVYVDASSEDVRLIEVKAGDGTLSYQVEFVHMQQISGFKMPEELRISNGKKASLRIVVERFWPNVPVSDDLFILAKPQ